MIAAALALPLAPLLARGVRAEDQPPDYDKAANEAREVLAELLAADTSNPPGNEARAVAIGVKRLTQAEVPFEVSDFAAGRQNLVARLKGDGSERPLLLLAHTDVVGTSGQSWSSPPHELVERDGYLVGRGTGDDLGMAAVELEVLLILKRTGTALKRDVIVAWTGDEESGGSGVKWLLANKKSSIDAALAINEGGGLVLGDDGGLKFVSLQTAEKIYQDFKVVAHGPTGHSSVPLADNAIYRLARALDRLAEFRFPVRLLPVTRASFAARAAVESAEIAGAMRAVAEATDTPPADAVEVLDGDPILAASLRTTCVATQIEGGTRPNALPAEASANINCRILPDETTDDVRQKLAEVFADDALEIHPSLEFGHAEPSPLEGPGPDAIRKVIEEGFPDAPVIPSMSRGATDSRYLRAAGIPAYGLSPIANTEADGRRAHGVDERIPAASLRPAVELLHRLVLELAGKEPPASE
jgi:acetylornithine deacetylase/succinyl-diaminopimelate desuccinylase-like protein